MHRAPAFVPLIAVLVLACASPAPPAAPPPPAPPSSMTPASSTAPSSPSPSADAAFASLAADFLAGYLSRSPVEATLLGDHSHDGAWPDGSAEGEAELRRFLSDTRAKLASIAPDALSDSNRVDARILEDQIDRIVFTLDEVKHAENDPVSYTTLLGDGLDPLLTRSFAPISDRMRSLRARLLGLSNVVAVAKARLKNPPRVSTETGIDQVKGLVALCEHGLSDSLAQVPDQRAEIEAAAKLASASLRDLQTFFEKELLARSTGSFRMGRARFDKLLRFRVEDDIDADQLVADAQATMDSTLVEMVDTARELWPTLVGGPVPAATTADAQRALVRRVLAKLADDATQPKTIVTDAGKLLGDATRFVGEHDLVGLPTEPCKVIEMPEYKRGVAIAYCESSGPLEKKQETFFAISPAPRTWSAKRAASFYREYNKSMLVDLTVHEAMPGHYLQAMHANAFHSDVRAVFENGAFVEGWAVYGEWLMAKYGFGGPKTRLQRQKMVLRVAANVLIDHGVHAGTMEEKEALALMTDRAFQEEGEAIAKWQRARLTCGQLSTYFYGFREFMKLRRAAEQTAGFRERPYHDRLLAYGAPPMRDLRWLLSR